MTDHTPFAIIMTASVIGFFGILALVEWRKGKF